MACGLLCGVGVLWGLLLVFAIRVSFCWLRLLGTSRGGVVVAVRGFVAGGVACGRCGDCWVFLWVAVRGLLFPFCGGFACVSPWVWVAVAHGG